MLTAGGSADPNWRPIFHCTLSGSTDDLGFLSDLPADTSPPMVRMMTPTQSPTPRRRHLLARATGFLVLLAVGTPSTDGSAAGQSLLPGVRLTFPDALAVGGDKRVPLVLELRSGTEPRTTVWAWHPLAPHRYHPLQISKIEWEDGQPIRLDAEGELQAVPPWIGGAQLRVRYALEETGDGAARTYRVEVQPIPGEKSMPAFTAGNSTSLPHVARRGIAYNAWNQVPRVASLELQPARPAIVSPKLPEFRNRDPFPASGDAGLDRCRQATALALRAITGESGLDTALIAARDELANLGLSRPVQPGNSAAPPAEYDLRTAATAASTALLALAMPESTETSAAADAAALAVRRFLETGIGDRGCATGQVGLKETWELLGPFLLAWSALRGEDLAAGTGAGWAGLWWATETAQPDAGHLPAFLATAAPSVRAALTPEWERAGRPVSSPLQAWCAAVAHTNPTAKGPPLPRIIEDRTMQAYLMLDGDRRFRFHSGASPAPEVSPCGQFLLATGRTDWVRPVRGLPLFAWPDATRWNVVQALDSETTSRGAAAWTGRGQRARVEVRADGSASFSARGGSFRETDTDADNAEELEESHHWRTVGIDTSGRSGAGTVMVFVEGNDGLKDRQQVWQIQVGNWPEQAVRITDRTFEVRLPGGQRVLAGTVLYPASAQIAYEPAGPDGGKLRIYRWRPGRRAPEALEGAMDRLEKEIGAFLGKSEGSGAERDLREFRLEDDTAELSREAALERLQKLYFLRILRETSSVKMGAPDRKGRARDSWVIAMTVSDGVPPPIRPAKDESGPFLWVGPQPVHYEEHLIRFGEAE